MAIAPKTPALSCPNCKSTLEYHVTIEMLDPPIGKIDTGYCQACARMFECVRQTGTFYDSTLWPPLCRTCRQPVAVADAAAGTADAGTVLFQCLDHADEQWVWARNGSRWSRIA